MEKIELLDKISSILNKYKWNYQNININILSKNEKMSYYNISIEYDDNIIETKKYKKHLVPYNRKNKINPNSLNNLKYIKTLNSNKVNSEKEENVDKSNEKKINEYIINNNQKVNDESIIKIDNKDINKNIDTNILDLEKNSLNIKSENTESNINFDNNYGGKSDFIDIDVLFNREIDDTNCDNCQTMDNNVLYLSNKVRNIYLDIIKKHDNIIDTTFNVNVKLEELINLQNVNNKNMRIDIYNILQNKKKLNINDIEYISNILMESNYEMPHISTLFRNKIVDPIMEELRFYKNEYNEFIELTN